MKYAFTILLVLSNTVMWANSTRDSLENLIKVTNQPTEKAGALNNLAWHLRRTNPDTALLLTNQALQLSKNIQYPKGEAKAYSMLRALAWTVGDFDEALDHATKSLEIYEEMGDKKGLSHAYHNIGLVHQNQSDYAIALEFHNKSLKLREELGNKKGMAHSYNNIGIIYIEQSNHTRALEYYFKSLQIKEEMGDSNGIAGSYITIGNVYMVQSDFETALEYQYKARDILEELGNKRWLSMSYNNIGIICKKQGKFQLALDYYRKSLNIRVEAKNKSGIAGSLTNIGMLYTALYDHVNKNVTVAANTSLLDSSLLYQKNALLLGRELSDEYTMTNTLLGIAEVYVRKQSLDLANQYFRESLEMGETIGSVESVSLAHKGLAGTYVQTSDFKSALYHFKAYTTLTDSLFNQDKSKEIGKIEAKHEFETAEEEKRRLEAARVKTIALQKIRRDNLQYSGILIFLVLVFAGVFALGRITIPIRLAEGLIFFSFLLFFEFTLVLLDPYIEQFSSGAPAIKLGFNALLAGLIFPLHSLFEVKLKGSIVKT